MNLNIHNAQGLHLLGMDGFISARALIIQGKRAENVEPYSLVAPKWRCACISTQNEEASLILRTNSHNSCYWAYLSFLNIFSDQLSQTLQPHDIQ